MQVCPQLLDDFVKEDFLSGELFQWCVEVALADFSYTGHCFFLYVNVTGNHFIDANGQYLKFSLKSVGGYPYIDVSGVVLRRHMVHLTHQACEQFLPIN